MRRGLRCRALLITLGAIAALALGFGCTKKDRAGTLTVAVPQGPVALDPRLTADATGDKIAHLICDGLFRKNAELEMVPLLAERFEQLSETSYRFHLRPKVLFHDGTPLTAEDVAYTYRSIIDGSVPSPYRSSFDRIKKIVVEGPLTVRIDLVEPYAPFLVMLSRGIVPKQAAERMGGAFATHPIGTGPYRFVRFVTDSIVELEANERYFGAKPKTKRLQFQIIKDDNIRVLKLIKGDVDLVQNGVPPLLIDNIVEKPNLTKQEDTGIVVSYMGFNLADPILKKQRVRQALAYAIDRDEIISHRWQGLAVKANSILAPSNWAYDRSLGQYDYDPQKAMRLLDAAGYPDPDGAGPKPRLALTLKTSTNKERIDIARMIAHQLAKVGIALTVEPYEWGTFFRDVKTGNFQVYTLSWVGIIEPDIFYDVYDSKMVPPAGLNRGHYANPKIDALVRAGRRTMDRAKRKEIYKQVQRILFEELPSIPLWYEKNVVVYQKDLAGVSLRPDASYRVLVDVEKQ